MGFKGESTLASIIQTKAVWTLVNYFTCTIIIVVDFNEMETKYELQWIQNDKYVLVIVLSFLITNGLFTSPINLSRSTLGSILQTKAVWASRGSQLWGVQYEPKQYGLVKDFTCTNIIVVVFNKR